MKKFEFANSSLDLDLCGHLFSVEVDEATMEKCEKIRRGANVKLSVLKKCETDVKTDDVCAFLADGIDLLLGGGAAAEIFGSRRMALLDLTDLLTFILSEIRGVIAEKTKKYAHAAAENAESGAKNA